MKTISRASSTSLILAIAALASVALFVSVAFAAPAISTSSTIANGANNPTVSVTGTNFAPTISASDLIVTVVATSLTLDTVTYIDASNITVAFTGTATAGDVTIQAKTTAFDPVGADLSNTLTVTVPMPVQATPTFSPDSGAVTWGTPVTISSLGADAIYYTTNGSTPTTGSTLYTVPVEINSTLTLKALAVKAGYTNSAIGSASYTQTASTDLANITLSNTPGNYTFAPSTYTYNGVTVANATVNITVTPTGAGTITVNGTPVASGIASGAISLTAGVESTILVVTTETGKSAKTYTIKVTPALPAMTGTVEITGAVKFGSLLTASSSLVNAGTPTYQWKRGGSPIGGATASTYTLVADDIGTIITVTATADGTVGTGSITSDATAAVAKADGPVAPSAPTLASKTATSITLTADALNQFSKDDGSTWQDSEVFSGLTALTNYTFVARVKETSTTNASIKSASSDTIKTDAPVMGGSVSITGTTKFGSTLTADLSSLTYTPATLADVPTYQWKRGGSIIGGATASTYILATDDIGTTITVVVTADGTHATGNVTSGATGAIAKADQSITFGVLADKTYGAADFSVNAVSDSSLDVVFDYSGQCTLSASTSPITLHITGAGTCDITASQVGDTNYNAASDVVRSFTINKAHLTVTADNKTKVYGEANPVLTATISGFVNSEVLGTSGVVGSAAVSTAADASTDVGTPAITVTGGTLDASNYDFTVFTPGVLTITQLDTTGSFTVASSKTYNSDVDVTTTGQTVDGKIGSDNVVLSGGTATYTSSNVANNTVVTLVGATLTGAKAGNYNLTSVTNTTANITPKHITGGFSTALSRAYDGTDSADVTSRSLTGKVDGDDVSLSGGTATFNNKNVGTGKTVTLTGASLIGADKDNYILDSVGTASANITVATLTVTATAADKVYDGGNVAVVTLSDDRIGGDDLTIASTSATFANQNAGNGKTVTVNGISISGGTDVNNYTLGNTTTTDTADITKANANIFAAGYTVTYDGIEHTAPITATGVNGEDLTADIDLSTTKHTNAGSYLFDTAAFHDPNGNYNDANSMVADVINKANPTIVVTPYSVTYSGTAWTASSTATGVLGEALAGLVVTGTTHTDADTYNGDAWTFTDVTGNYNNASGVVNNAIAKANATIVIDGYSGTYDGVAHGVTGTATGVNSEDLSAGLNLGSTFTNAPGGTATWAFTGGTNYNNNGGTAAVDIAKADADTSSITPYDTTYDGSPHTATGSAIGVQSEVLSGLNLSGTTHTSAGNTTDPWTFTDVTGNYKNTGGSVDDTIAQRTLTVSASAANKVYDGTPLAVATLSDDRVSGDSFMVASTSATFANKDVGTGKTVTVAGLSISGPAAGNYTLASTEAITTANITKADATFTTHPYNVTYDGSSHTAPVSAVGALGESLDSLFDLSGTTHTNVGDYPTDPWTFTDVTGNYNNASGTMHNVITKATATVAVDGYTGVYDGAAHGASTTATGVMSEDLSGSVDLGVSFTDVPGGTANWAFTNANYNSQSGSVAIVINIDPNASSAVLATTTNPDTTVSGTITNAAALATTTPIGDITVDIPAGLVVTGPSGWDGTINMPSPIVTDVAPTPDPANGANTATPTGSIEIGFGDTALTFDKGVRILIEGQAGKQVGYSHGAGTFTKITNVCSGDNQGVGDALAAGSDCAIDVGLDLVVWTRHFSTFTTYTTTLVAPVMSPSGSVFHGSQSVTMNEVSGTTIHYTVDGSTPTCSSPTYSGALTFSSAIVVKALRCDPTGVSATSAVSASSFSPASDDTSGGGGGGGGGSISTPVVAAVVPAAVTPVAPVTPTVQGQVLGAATYNFTKNLAVGSRGTEVTALQQALIGAGYSLPSGATGYFGEETRKAVIAFQKARGIEQLGSIGPKTRTELNKR